MLADICVTDSAMPNALPSSPDNAIFTELLESGIATLIFGISITLALVDALPRDMVGNATARNVPFTASVEIVLELNTATSVVLVLVFTLLNNSNNELPTLLPNEFNASTRAVALIFSDELKLVKAGSPNVGIDEG